MECECKDHGDPLRLWVRGERVPVTLPLPHGPAIALLILETQQLMDYIRAGRSLGDYPPEREAEFTVPAKSSSPVKLWLDKFKSRHGIADIDLADQRAAEEAWAAGPAPLLDWLRYKGLPEAEAQRAMAHLGVRDLLDLGPRPDLECLMWLPKPTLADCRKALSPETLRELLETARAASSAAFAGLLEDTQFMELYQYEIASDVAPIFQLWDRNFLTHHGSGGISDLGHELPEEAAVEARAAGHPQAAASAGGGGTVPQRTPLPTASQWEVWDQVKRVGVDELADVRPCGSGAFGVVSEATTSSGEKVAVKCCDVYACKSLFDAFSFPPVEATWADEEQRVREEVTRELWLLQAALGLEHVVQLVGAHPFEPPRQLPAVPPQPVSNKQWELWYAEHFVEQLQSPNMGADAPAVVRRFDRRFGFVVMQHAGAPLAQLVDSESKGGLKQHELTLGQFLEIACGAAAGLCNLHSRNMVHADVALRNLLWKFVELGGEKRIIVTIGDLGLGDMLPPGASFVDRENCKGPSWEGAPECFPVRTAAGGKSYRRCIGKQGDVFALAVVLSTLWTGAPSQQQFEARYKRCKELKRARAAQAQADLSASASFAAAGAEGDEWDYADILLGGRVEAPAESSAMVKRFTADLCQLIVGCTAMLPSARPNMGQVLQRLEEMAARCQMVHNELLGATIRQPGACAAGD